VLLLTPLVLGPLFARGAPLFGGRDPLFGSLLGEHQFAMILIQIKSCSRFNKWI
jgi:hypothetical protein